MGRVVPVMHLIAFRRPEAGPLNHHDGASWWFWRRRWSIVVVGPARHRAGAWGRWYQGGRWGRWCLACDQEVQPAGRLAQRRAGQPAFCCPP